ncbi:hypothetical protein ASG17_04185 [Brevundimonas sp. Leaf363]|uniref:alpha/beta fold hydrolase n=1 Tax=Brevundimonas sp. Leaf363 TaxID=1736353 RepID=UPI0006FE98D6|nr:hypothetical protein [Brevundimonas sp. Leaf363]KQS55300.1 hypothetical protein ASG17_04185 [Brevundimonas sp. Leaf363]
MSDETPAPFSLEALNGAIAEGDEATVRAVAASASTLRDQKQLLGALIESGIEAPDLITETFRRVFESLRDKTADDKAILDLSKRARQAALAAGRAAYADGDRQPLVVRLAIEAEARALNRDAVHAIGSELLSMRPITRHHMVMAKQMLNMGHREPVMAWIEAVEQASDFEGARDGARRMFEDLARHMPRDGSDESIMQVHERPGSRRVVFTFSGLSNRLGVSIEQMLTWTAALDTHVVVLKDPERLIYLKGVSTLGSDVRSTTEGMRRLAKRLGADEILCMGNSSGGFAALRYGQLAGATRTVGFGALTTLSAERTSQRADGRAPGMADRLMAEAREELGDCADWLRERDPPMAVDLYFGADMGKDRFHAENLADTPGVTLHMIPGLNEHGVVQHLAERDLMPAIMTAFIEGRPLPDAI